MAHDARIGQQPRDVLLAEARQLLGLEIGKARAERLALVQDGDPAQPRLEPFETKLLEQTPLVIHGEAPFVIVIMLVQRRGLAPETALMAAVIGEESCHWFR